MSKLIGYDEHFKPVYRKSIIDHREFITRKKKHIETYISRAEEACDRGDVSTVTNYRDMILVAFDLIEQSVAKVRDLEEMQAQ